MPIIVTHRDHRMRDRPNVLHRYELGPAVLLLQRERCRELPGPHAGRSDVAGFSGAYDVVQGLKGFFPRGGRVGPVDLVEVDVVEAEATQAVVDLAEDRLAG